ncbi:MAG: hypothetical protein J6M37_02125 [Prevotella sp.]|nr:hypothetical protein [Prevotella sp.]
MKIDWKKFHVYADIAKRQEVPVENPQEQVANAILQQGQGIAAYVLAEKVFKDDGETVYDEKEGRVIESLTTTLPAVWAVALKDIIE